MPNKTFRFTEQQLNALELIRAAMPAKRWGQKITLTDALIFCIQEQHDRTKNAQKSQFKLFNDEGSNH